MRKEIIVDDRPDRSLVAVMEDGQLMEIYFEYAKSCNSIGNLYKGKVENILPGMQAAFVDIGQERNGFLYVDDITDTLKKQAGNEKEIEKMKRDKMTADELKKYDDEKRDRELAEREQAIADRENRYYAISAIKKAGLDDGGDTALKIVDLVLGKDSDEIDNKVSALNELVNKLVDNKVNEKFKSAGRIPNTGSANANTNTEDKKGNELAKGLGKERAELKKKSDSILKHYI